MGSDLGILEEALTKLNVGFAKLPAFSQDIDLENLRKVMLETATAMHNNYPYHHPNYFGQMLKPPHPIARLAYMLSLYINPNNHAIDGGRASSAMEKECIQKIGVMFGWEQPLGHLCSGGTMANLEALWVSHQRRDGIIVASEQAHYTHRRICGVLKIPFKAIGSNNVGCMDVERLKIVLEKEKVSTVVVTMGTTALGSVDPLIGILELQQQYGFLIHADCAYGGYFTLADNLELNIDRQFQQLQQVDSIVIDPHKHGLQPYGCGCVLFKDPRVGKYYKHDSPYTYFSSESLHLGEISLECSRPGSAAVALWATMKMLPLVRGGDFSKMLSKNISTAIRWHQFIENAPHFVAGPKPSLDIVVWAFEAESAQEASVLAQAFFKYAEQQHLYLALVKLPTVLFPKYADSEVITCLRTCFMKPEHEKNLDQLIDQFNKVVDDFLSNQN